MAFRLSIEDGPYVQTLEVRSGSLTVGKKPANGLALSSPGLSERHAVFRQEGDRVEVRAMPTKIGVRVNGERVDHALLAPGDATQVGWARITVVDVTPESAAPPPETPAEVPAPLQFEDTPAATLTVAAPVVASSSAAESNSTIAAARPVVVRHAAEPAVDFVVLSRRAVRVLPWWGISVAIHAIAFIALVFFTTPKSALDAIVDKTFVVTIRQTPQRVDVENVVVVEPTRRGVEMPRPNMDVPMEVPDSLLPTSPTPKGAGGTAAPRADDTLLVDESGGNAPWTAPGGSTSIGVGSLGRVGSQVGTDLDAMFGFDGAGRANAAAAGMLNGDAMTRSLVAGLKLRTNERNVKVVRGDHDYDHCEIVLEALGLGHGFLAAPEIRRQGIDADVRAIFFNCTGTDPLEKTVAELQRWVSEGGWLFTSDWAVKWVVSRSFSGYIDVLKDGAREAATADNNETITFTVAPGRHPLLDGLPHEAETSIWWLEESSTPFVIVKPEYVEVLVQSADLERKYKSKLVAVTFPYGKGRVVHVLGHMYQKKGNVRGAYAMQRLLINFLYQAIRQ